MQRGGGFGLAWQIVLQTPGVEDGTAAMLAAVGAAEVGAAVDCGLQLSCCVRDWACLADCVWQTRETVGGTAAMLAALGTARPSATFKCCCGSSMRPATVVHVS
jgi:hypothetical protein